MKTTIKRFISIAALIAGFSIAAYAQNPSDPNTELFCSGSTLTLPALGVGESYTVHYDTDDDYTGSTPVNLTSGNTITGTDLKTGYYFIMKTEAGGCLSEPTAAIPVYVFKPITVDFSSADYCIEQANTPTSTFTATVTTTETGVTDYAYQWYTVDGSGNETPISGANTSEFTATSTTVGTTTYRVKAGYLIGTDKYCGVIADHDVEVKAAPTAPNITITGATAETW